MIKKEEPRLIPESFIEELKYASDIERVISSYVSLKRRGRHLTGLCPFHSEKTASFTVYPDSQNYYCFGCGNGGDVITFVRNIEHLEYVEALRFLAEKAGLTLPEDAKDDRAARIKSRVLEINRESARFFHTRLISGDCKPALDYLINRGLTMKTIRTFGLGFSLDSWDALRNHLGGKGFAVDEMAAAAVIKQGRGDNHYDVFRGRVMFPIIDLRGNVIGFGGRAMDDNGPKYLNSPDTPVFKKSRNLFALNFAKSAKSDTLILGEGYMDVIAMHQAGFTNAVATLGTSLTEEQSRLISQYANRVVIAYDSDNAGQNATKRAINLFAQVDVSVGVLEIKDAKDPDEYIKKYGAQRFRGLIESGRGAVEFEIAKLKNGHDLATSEGTVAFLTDFCKLMAGIDNDIERGVHIGNIARELDVGRQGLESNVTALRKKKFASMRKKEAHNLHVYAQDNAGTRMKPRHNDLTSLVAEDWLISLLIKNPDYYESIKQQLSPGDFTNDDSRAIYSALAERLEANLPCDLTYLSQSLSNEQMSKLSGLMAKSRDFASTKEQLFEYIGAIKAQKQKKSDTEIGEMSPAELSDYVSKLRNK